MSDKNLLKQMLDEISVVTIWDRASHVCETWPDRLPGTPGAKAYGEYVAAYYNEIGLDDVKIHTGMGLLKNPGPCDVRLRFGGKEEKLDCNANAQCGDTPMGGFSGELVYVGPGGEDDYDGVDANGKVILTELSYAPPRSEKMRLGMVHGAIAMVIMNWGPETSTSVPYGTSKSVWGNPTPEDEHFMYETIPVFSISKADGVRLRKMLEAGEKIDVFMNYQQKQGWDPLYLPSGTVKAPNNQSGEFVLVAGHMDSWPVGASDNAAGNATAMELARVLQANRDKLSRDVRFLFWQGHEGGQMEGSTWYCDNLWDDLNKHCVMYINIDAIGLGDGATVLHSEPAFELWDWIHEMNEFAMPGWEKDYCFPFKNADMSFLGIGIPSCYNWIYHTPELRAAWGNATLGLPYHSADDTMDTLDKNVMYYGVRDDAAFLFDMAMRKTLPQKFTIMASEISKRIGEMKDYIKDMPEAQEGLDLDGALAMSKIFEEKAAEVETVRLSAEAADIRNDKLNYMLMRISRVVMPMLTTVTGRFEQDRYGLTGLKYIIPNSVSVLELSQRKEGTHEFYLWLNRARKERNKITDALDMAIDICNQILADNQ